MKLVISNKEGKAKQIELEEDSPLRGLKIGDKVDGSKIGYSGYEFEIKGGSDSSGFPMRRDVQGTERKRILSTGGVGVHINRKGMKKRKTVRGNTVSDDTAQLNLYVTKQGKEDIFAENKEESQEGSEQSQGEEKKQ